MQEVLWYASIATMPAKEPKISIVCEGQAAHGEENSVLICLADR